MIEVTAYDKAVARAAARALGGEPRVIEYRGDDDREPIAVLQSADRPTPGFVAYSTVSLHRAPNLVGERDIRVELLGVAPAGKAEFGNLLAGAAGLADTLEHLVLCPPFAYEQLGAVELDDGPSVHWLQAVPISESERRFHLAHGFDALEARFTEAEMEYWDLDRAPLA
jgi:hypothetical protein